MPLVPDKQYLATLICTVYLLLSLESLNALSCCREFIGELLGIRLGLDQLPQSLLRSSLIFLKLPHKKQKEVQMSAHNAEVECAVTMHIHRSRHASYGRIQELHQLCTLQRVCSAIVCTSTFSLA